MNIFVLSTNPIESAKMHPSKVLNKMSLEGCQMLATVFSEHYLDWGTLPKKDGTPYKPTHKNHPCTKWIAESHSNIAWTIVHSMALALEHRNRYGRLPATYRTLQEAKKIFEQHTRYKLLHYRVLSDEHFIRAMDSELKENREISNVEAYKQYIRRKSYFNGEF